MVKLRALLPFFSEMLMLAKHKLYQKFLYHNLMNHNTAGKSKSIPPTQRQARKSAMTDRNMFMFIQIHAFLINS